MLPDYLKFKTNGNADPNQTVIIGNIRFTLITSRLIRIEENEFVDEATLTVINRAFDNPYYNISKKDGILQIQTEHLILNYKIGQALSSESLQIRLLTKPYTQWNFGDKAIFNLGGTVSTLDGVNGEIPIDDGICAIDGFSVIDDTSTPLILKNGWFKVRNQGNTDLYFFGYGHDYTACIKDYYRLTGVPQMLPAFALGNWWSRYYKYTQEEYIALMEKFRQEDIPFSVGIVDMDWHITDEDGREYKKDGWTGYTWNKKLFPDYKQFLQELHKKNLRTALNLHPADGVRCWDDMYSEMSKALKIELKNDMPIPFDCLNEDFWKAYFEVLHFPYEKDGVDFWWMDWQQGTDYSWIHKYNDAKNDLECITPLWILNHMHYLASMRENKRGFIFSRYSGFGSQRYPIGFSGDTDITWEMLDFEIYFTVTASNIGYGWWSHDIGGHHLGYRDDELTVRWVQFGVFSPILRLHSTQNQFLGREPWNYNKRAELAIKDYMKLRHKLFPYIYTMNYRNYSELIPLMRPIYHTHPEEKEAYTVKNEYWFGSEMLVAPITKKCDRISDLGYTHLWLPDGIWIDWFNGYVYRGGKIEAYRTLEQMPIFLKAGAIVPMQPHIPQENKLGLSDKLEIIIASGGSNSFTLYEDDGETNDYKDGHYAKTKFDLVWGEKSATFTINAVIDDKHLTPEKRDYLLLFKGYRKGCSFYINSIEQNIEYNEEENSYSVLLQSVKKGESVTLTLKNPVTLLHDNSDFEVRVNDMIMRAQCSHHERNNMLIYANLKLEEITKTPYRSDGENRLPHAIYELAKELIK